MSLCPKMLHGGKAMTAKPAVLEMPSSKPAKEKRRRRDRGTGRLYQRGKTWWIAYHVRGEKGRESAHTDNKTDAQDLLRDRLVENKQNGRVAPARLVYEQLRDAMYDDY